MLFETIKKDLIDAMKTKDILRLETIRLVVSQIKNEAIKQGDRENIADELVLSILQRRMKQGKESLSQFENAGRKDLAENEKKQLTIIEKYMPEMMSKEEITKIALEKKESLGIADKSKMGQLMGALMGELKGKVDGGLVKEVVNELF